MFEYEDSVKFINIDTEYVKSLHDACSEVFYRDYNYSYKPYLGVLVCSGGKKYAIPLTSAKEKHKGWKNVYPDRMLLIEYEKKSRLSKKDIWVDEGIQKDKVKHILSAIDLKKMIPIRDDVISSVDLNVSDEDDDETKKYKHLLNKEYSACVKLKDDILQKIEKIYDRQITTGRIGKFCCDFRLLEKVSDEYGVSVEPKETEDGIKDAIQNSDLKPSMKP